MIRALKPLRLESTHGPGALPGRNTAWWQHETAGSGVLDRPASDIKIQILLSEYLFRKHYSPWTRPATIAPVLSNSSFDLVRCR